MKAFATAISADEQYAETETNILCGLRESISYAIGLYDDKLRFFEQYGLTRDLLADYDRDIEYMLDFNERHPQLSREDLDFLIPFVNKMGYAYSQLMADSFVTNPNNAGTTAIEHAGRFHPILNFFYAQKAKLYPACANELTFEKS